MRLSLILVLLFGLISCGGNPPWLPRAHKITIQQGNLLSNQQFESIDIGMSRESVRSLLGSPVAATPFHADRWDYLYTQGPAGSVIRAKRLSIFFENEIVARLDSNDDDHSGEIPVQRNWWEKLFPPKRPAS